MNKKPALTCYGGVGAVTGANFLLETESLRVLIDCGLLQGLPDADKTNAEKFDYEPSSIDLLFITHAHLDHIDKVPKLVKDGFKGIIYSTEETKEIARLMLEDMVHITESNAVAKATLPLYGMPDVEAAMALWQPLKYHEPKDFKDYMLELYDAGHILGSAMYKFTFPSGRSILFTGDTGNSPAPLEKDTEFVPGLSYLLIDSVYGDRNHEKPEVRDKKFEDIVADTGKRGGTLLIPAFALERTEVILFELKRIFDAGSVKAIPVFLDSPLAIKVLEIYEKKMGHMFDFKSLKETAEVRDSKEILNIQGAKIILAGSGMSTAGRIQIHEAHYLPDPNATLLFAGYQAAGTLGRQIEDGAKSVMIKNVSVPVKARIVTINGYSAHKDSDHLVDFVSHTKDTLKACFVVMGEPKSEIFLAQRLHDELGVKAIVPQRGDRFELDL
jgi:metallo-beta-lactamase family protein